MNWFRYHHGTSCDPKWLLIARACGTVPGVVSAVWAAYLEHASQAKPRGSVTGFDAESYAAFSGFELELVHNIVAEFRGRRLEVDGVLAKWAKRQSVKRDTTATERKRRQRERDQQSAQRDIPERMDADARGSKARKPLTSRTKKPVTPVTPVTDESASRPVTNVTPLDRERESLSIVGNASSSSTLDTPNNPYRERASARSLTAGAIWEQLEAEGLAPGFFKRHYHAATIQRWVAAATTEQQLTDAIDRARAARKREGSSQPIPLGYLDALLRDVRSGRPATPANRMEAADAATDAYVARRLGA